MVTYVMVVGLPVGTRSMTPGEKLSLRRVAASPLMGRLRVIWGRRR